MSVYPRASKECTSRFSSPQSWPDKLGQLDKWSFLPDNGQDGRRAGETMSKRARRNHAPAFKAKVALAAIKGEKTLADLAQQFDIHSTHIPQGKAQPPDGAAGGIRG